MFCSGWFLWPPHGSARPGSDSSTASGDAKCSLQNTCKWQLPVCIARVQRARSISTRSCLSFASAWILLHLYQQYWACCSRYVCTVTIQVVVTLCQVCTSGVKQLVLSVFCRCCCYCNKQFVSANLEAITIAKQEVRIEIQPGSDQSVSFFHMFSSFSHQ